MEEHYEVTEHDGSMTDGGMKSYQNELVYQEPDDSLEHIDFLCMLMEARLV